MKADAFFHVNDLSWPVQFIFMNKDIYTNEEVKQLTKKILPELTDFFLKQDHKTILIGYHDPGDLIKWNSESPLFDLPAFRNAIKYDKWSFDENKIWSFDGIL